jgi:hypothetical protein
MTQKETALVPAHEQRIQSHENKAISLETDAPVDRGCEYCDSDDRHRNEIERK